MSDTELEAEVRRVVLAALELEGHARAALVDGACADDPLLRARVERLLVAAELEDGFLGGPGSERAGAQPDASCKRAAPLTGSRIGPYQLAEPLGEGGFGVVFAADQEHPVRRRVALKLLRVAYAGLGASGVLARFDQERQALALMDHAAIARVLDAGETDEGRPYFVMELVQGEPITAYCDRARLDVRRRLALLAQVCRAVQHAHTKGVIHRDIKPSNVLAFTGEEGEPVVKVIDFGIAKALQGPLTDKTLVTETRQFIGTPEYMSPEQAAGDPDIDTRSDVYSLGVLAYELLCGSTPFDPRHLRGVSLGEMQRLLREVDPPPPSKRATAGREVLLEVAELRGTAPERLGKTLRGELDWIVMRALEKERARRYESAGELAADVERFLAGAPVLAAPPSLGYRARKLARRHRGKVVAGGLVLATLLLGIVSTSVALVRLQAAQAELVREATYAELQAERATEEARRADLGAAEAQQSARVAASVNELMTTMVARANRAREGGRDDVTVREVMDAAARELEERPGGYEPAVELLLASTIGAIQRELALHEPAERMLRLVADRTVALHGAQSVEHAWALGELASLARERGDAAQAAELYETARGILDEAPASEARDDRLARLRTSHAALLAGAGQLAEARRELELALAHLEARPQVGGDDHATALHNLAAVLHRSDELEPALALLVRVVELERARLGEDDPRTLATLHGISVLQYATGDLEAAEASLRHLLAATRRLRGDEHPQVGSILDTLGMVALRRGELDAAIELFREARGLALATFGARHPTTAERNDHLVTPLLLSGEPDHLVEAEALLREALAAWTGVEDAREGARVAPVIPDAVYAWYRLGHLLAERGALEEAETLARAALVSAYASLEDGHRQAWLRCALKSLLGGVLTLAADGSDLTPQVRREHLHEAEELLEDGGACLLAATTMGRRTREQMIEQAVARCIAHYELRERTEPSPEVAAALAAWRARLPER